MRRGGDPVNPHRFANRGHRLFAASGRRRSSSSRVVVVVAVVVVVVGVVVVVVVLNVFRGPWGCMNWTSTSLYQPVLSY